MKTKKVWKLFFAWQDNKEEEWLQEMAKQGWALKTLKLYYTFEKIQPMNYVYKLDYKTSNNKDLEEYITIFEDAGWKHVTQLGAWHYFRTEGNGEVAPPDIYSDNESKIQKYKGLLNSLYLGLLAMVLLSLNFLFNLSGEYSLILKIFYLGIITLLLLGVINVKQKVKNLKKESDTEWYL